MEFLSKENQCGQNLLRIVSRGSAILAELFRLSGNLPEVFLGGDKVKDPEQRKYLDVIFDFQYLNQPEDYEKRINDSLDLLDLDQEFQDNHEEILDRFYRLFESIWKYQHDFSKYIDDVNHGYYIQHSLETILQEVEGKQLLCEALYLYGVMLLLLEERLPGYIREKLLVSMCRLRGEGALDHFEEICKLCRNTGYIPGPEGKRPKNFPDMIFARYPPDQDLVRLVIGRLQTDDIYLMSVAYPDPAHRSTRLANQAAMLYVILYFAPDILNKQKSTMREITDKYFHDNFVIAIYMGNVVDLTQEWASYPAAKAAIDNVISVSTVKQWSEANGNLMAKGLEELKAFLKEGVLAQDFLLDHLLGLFNCVRTCNISLRWRMLHRRCKAEALRKAVDSVGVSPSTIATLLLNISQLEYLLKGLLTQMLADKDLAWTEGRASAVQRLNEVSSYFAGEAPLTRVKKDDNLTRWFSGLASQVEALDFRGDGHATAIGRKIQGLIAALEDVEQFEAVDSNNQIKTCLQEIRDLFQTMIRTVNIKEDLLMVLESLSDLSYAWQLLADYVPMLHDRIRRDPGAVVLLRATFLKAASILDVPLVRITAAESPDAVSVAAYYSGELVDLVRLVLEVIPISIFNVLGQIVTIQTEMTALPMRLEGKDLKDYAQLEARWEMAKLTHEVSIFTEGILVMEKTLLGVIQVEPRQILEEGLRRELVRQVSLALHRELSFEAHASREEVNRRMLGLATRLDGLKRSIEYLQDYIAIAGLKIFQQEFSRIINYYAEQEANRFLKKKTFDSSSRFQSRAIPIPRLLATSPATTGGPSSGPSGGLGAGDEAGAGGAVTFLGRVMASLMDLTDPATTVYAPECSAWFLHSAPDAKVAQTIEQCGIRTFALLERSIGVIGLQGLNRLLAFRAVHICNYFLRYFEQSVRPFRTLLDQVRTALYPEHRIPENAAKLYLNAVKKVEPLLLPVLKCLRRLGQGQLVRRQICNLLEFGCQLDAHLLYQALDTFNRGLVKDIRKHYLQPDSESTSHSYMILAGDDIIVLIGCFRWLPCRRQSFVGGDNSTSRSLWLGRSHAEALHNDSTT